MAAALERLATDILIADDGPHVLISIGVNVGHPPTVWIADREGNHYDVAAIRHGNVDAPDDGEPDARHAAPWRMTDLVEAANFLVDWVNSVMHTGHGLASLAVAGQAHVARRDAVIERQLRKDAYELANPHVCDGCRRRFPEELARDVHRRRCTASDGHHFETGWVQQIGAITIICNCGGAVNGATYTEARRRMRDHIDARARREVQP